MHLARVVLTAPRGAATSRVTAALAIDLAWAVAELADRVEHIAALTVQGAVELGVFTMLPDQATAQNAALRLAERVRDISPLLHGWTVDSL